MQISIKFLTSSLMLFGFISAAGLIGHGAQKAAKPVSIDADVSASIEPSARPKSARPKTTQPMTAQPMTTQHSPVTPTQQNHKAAQFSALLLHHQDLNARAERLLAELRLANTHLCTQHSAEFGFTLHRLSDYPVKMRPLARIFLHLRDQGYHIRSLTLPSLHQSQGPAPMIGDRLTMINQSEIDVFFNQNLDKGNDLRPSKTRDTTQRRGSVLGALQVNTSFELAFKRADGSLYNSVIIPQKSCDIAVFVSPSEQINGYSNGVDTITITTALAEAIEQDLTLSLILAHEMAHIIIVQHALPMDENLELKADQIALLLLHNAGLDGAKAVQHWQGFNHPHADLQENSATHFGIKTRMENFQKTLNHISDHILAHIKPQTEPEQKLGLSVLP